MGPDIVYPLRRGKWNEELRYSLRSVEANVPHHRIIISGGKPDWLRTSETLIHLDSGPQPFSKWRNSARNIKAAIEALADTELPLSAPFLLFNDDFYVLQPLEKMPVYTQGPLEDVIDHYRRNRHTGAYWRGMVETFELLRAQGFEHPLSYGLHVPLPIYAGPWFQALAMGKDIQALHLRTLYGNLAGLGGIERDDVKPHHKPKDQWAKDFLSSNDDLHLTGMQSLLQDLFPAPCTHELD